MRVKSKEASSLPFITSAFAQRLEAGRRGRAIVRRSLTNVCFAAKSDSSSDLIRFTPAFCMALQAPASDPRLSIPRDASSITNDLRGDPSLKLQVLPCNAGAPAPYTIHLDGVWMVKDDQ
jgi:hypothetical protein